MRDRRALSWWSKQRDIRFLRVGTRGGKPLYLIGTFSPGELVLLGVIVGAALALFL